MPACHHCCPVYSRLTYQCLPTLRTGIAILWLLSVLASGDILAAQDQHPSSLADKSQLTCTSIPWTTEDSTAGLQVNGIQINAGDLFNDQRRNESQIFHSAANALHIATRNRTVLQALPFRRGDVLVKDSLEEAERVLRSRRYLRSASVVPVSRCGETVDIEVRTVDNWTLTPSISLSSKGGVERYKIEVQDLNVLGLGKELTFRQEESDGERETRFVYGDDNVLGSQHRLRLTLGATDSGDLYGLSIGRPFVSSQTATSWWIDAAEESKALSTTLTNATSNINDNAELDGEDSIAQHTQVDVGLAKKLEHSDADVARLGVGFRHERQRTVDLRDIPIGDSSDFSEQYPYVYAQWARSNWTEQRNFLGLGKVEDIDTGLGVRIELGLILDALGNDTDAVRVAGSLSRGFWTSPTSVHRLSLDQTHYFGDGTREKLHLGARYHYFRWLSQRDHLNLQIVADQQRGYSRSDDIELGGEFGLKGYRNGYQTGDTRLLGIAEYRHVTDWTPFALVNLGWGVFAEAGKAWRGVANEQADTLVDVGAGFMFSPSRSTRNEIVRLDITFPLTDGEGVDSFLLYAGTQLKF